MTQNIESRRSMLVTAGLTAPALIVTAGLLTACSDKDKEKDTPAVEDLMREHGVLRRAILVFRESASKLRRDVRSVDPKALNDTAELFRKFGEDYHERKLEEAYIFPAVRKAGGPAAGYIDILLAQHNRGRDLTGYILAVTAKGTIGSGDADPLAKAFDAFELMYANHTAREDTVIFPAWKQALSSSQIDEMGDKFEDIEKQEFGKDGFDDAVQKMDRIEQALGLSDIGQFTAPPPTAG
jgi:hemerythrin-like domain-containing protein